MCQLILDLDDHLLAKAEAVAVTQHTTVTTLIQNFLESLPSGPSNQSAHAAQRLQATFAKYSRDMGERRWTRESLYER
ncbi:MAG: hypothetical protein HZA46_12365 [Planctomycetales bacterium]|nr:hypothetical protein [Planctomycetales bacterium]